jgi:predicted Ser/Thr protein kinase
VIPQQGVRFTSPPQIARYQIVRRLGHGGMGTVYLGRDPDLDRNVAIKVLREPLAEDELLERFLREARATASLRHENLVTIYQVGEHEHQPFIAMEYVDGTTLSEIIKRRQGLPVAQKLTYLEQICAGLSHAHRFGIVHRDIKPANVMVDSQDVVRILDFGIARVANSGMTTDGALMGTLNYMSPEQMIGRPVDYRSDIFSVGALAYELLSYQQAFPGSMSDGLLHRLPNEPPAPFAEVCPGLPAELEGIVLRALAKAPQDRFPDLDEMRTAVHRVRRSIDPQLQLETVVIPSRNKQKPSTRPASSQERRALLERRAKQIAVHRDAARAALARGDLEGAAAACDDALTLDPDDQEASQLLEEIQQAKERREQESKNRRERERAVRHRVADAELTLLRGDVASAARQLEQVLGDEPRDVTALTLLDKVRDAATSAGVALPESLITRPRAIVAKREPTGTSPKSLESSDTTDSGRSWMLAVAASVVVLAIGGGMVWMMGRDEGVAPAPATVAAASGNPATPPNEAASPPLVTGNPPAATPVTSSVGTGGAETATSQPSASAPLAPAPASPAPASPASAPSPNVVDALAAPLARIDQLYRKGDLAAALAELDRIDPSSDKRVIDRAASIWQAAARSMDEAHSVADSQKAAELAQKTYASGEQARRLANNAASRNDYAGSARQALQAASAYRSAESEARLAAAASPTAKPAAPPANAAATSAPASPAPTTAPVRPASTPESTSPPRAESSPPASTPTPTRVEPPPPAASPTPAATVPRPSAIDGERAGIVRALTRYQDAYRQRSVKALEEAYANLGREARQDLERQFKECRAFDLSFGNVNVSLSADDPTAATVNVLSTYQCQPRTGQKPISYDQQDVFQLRKVSGEWIIERTGAMNNGRRR